MKIKLALLDDDRSYLNRLAAAFNTKYTNVEIYSFTDKDAALGELESSGIEVFAAAPEFGVDKDSMPARCSFALLARTGGIARVNDCPVICKYQSVDMFYKQVIDAYSEKSRGEISGRSTGEGAAVVTFSSPCGGAGTSTLAAACAVHFAGMGKKVLFLNFEKIGSTNIFFSAPGPYTMRDLIIAIKSRKANLAVKLESAVKRDESGVYFYSEPVMALDMTEIDYQGMLEIVKSAAIGEQKYDIIVLNADFDISADMNVIYGRSDFVVWCTDGSESSNSKIVRAYRALETREQSSDIKVCDKIRLIYNKHTAQSRSAAFPEEKSIGAIEYNVFSSAADAVRRIAPFGGFDKLSV